MPRAEEYGREDNRLNNAKHESELGRDDCDLGLNNGRISAKGF